MQNNPNRIVLNTQSIEAETYIAKFNSALLQTFQLIFERRELDLQEEQLAALQFLL